MLDGVAAASGAEATGSVVIIIACGVAICRRAMPALAVVGSGALSAAAASDATGDRPDESVTFDLPLREVACKSNYFAYLTCYVISDRSRVVRACGLENIKQKQKSIGQRKEAVPPPRKCSTLPVAPLSSGRLLRPSSPDGAAGPFSQCWVLTIL